jgi:hypothetical protein
MAQAPAATNMFRNFDDPAVYKECLELNLLAPTLNFVVEFGGDEARIAFDLSSEDVTKLLEEKPSAKRPVRWM